MQIDLSGLRALVTGSTKGIGRAVAQELAANGAEVVINGRKAADVQEAIASLRATLPKGRFKAAPGDAATAAGIASTIEAAGDVDILVNNVGVFEIKDAFEIPDEDWERFFTINVLSGVRFTRHYGPRMREKRFGRIIFISSESGVQIPTEMIHYGFTKAANLAGRKRRDGECGAARAHAHRGCRRDVQGDGQVGRRPQSPARLHRKRPAEFHYQAAGQA